MPDDFVPERWTSKTHMTRDAHAFNGFGGGMSCPYKKYQISKKTLNITQKQEDGLAQESNSERWKSGS